MKHLKLFESNEDKDMIIDMFQEYIDEYSIECAVSYKRDNGIYYQLQNLNNNFSLLIYNNYGFNREYDNSFNRDNQPWPEFEKLKKDLIEHFMPRLRRVGYYVTYRHETSGYNNWNSIIFTITPVDI